MKPRIVALAGGVGGAKLADGLAQISELSVIVNTADDFEHLGLSISPDLDTVMYTLAGVANPETGWGVRDEGWNVLQQIGRLGGETWFKLGDRDLAVHILRSQRLRDGQGLTAVMRELCAALGVRAQILPMSDQRVGTIVHTAEGPLPFQEYFVARQCNVAVTGFAFSGIETAAVTEDIVKALSDSALSAIVVAPSNPYVSIDPILAVPKMRGLIAAARVPVVGVSPIIGGQAVKGPAARMMRELGHDVSALTVARHYASLLSALVIDRQDETLAPAIRALGLDVVIVDTLMRERADRRRVAEACLSLAGVAAS